MKSKAEEETGNVPRALRSAGRLILVLGTALFANAVAGSLDIGNPLVAVWGLNFFVWAVVLRMNLLRGRAWTWWLLVVGSFLLLSLGLIGVSANVFRLTSGLPVHRTPFIANLCYVVLLPLLLTQLFKKEARAAVSRSADSP